MFDLDHPLAQEIADRAMAILPRNVNVMDSQGLIIGTGEPDRLYTRHEGAQLVLANSRAVEIDSAAASALRGVQEGVNLPLYLDDQVIGVVGVSGDPEEVRAFAQMVRMTAEMLVAQRNDQHHRLWLQERREEVLTSILISGQSVQRAIVEAQRLGLKPELHRTPVFLEVDNPEELERVKQWLERQVADAWCIALQGAGLVWCTPRSVTPDFLEQLGRAGRKIARVAIGTPDISASALHSEVQQLVDLVAYAQTTLYRWLTANMPPETPVRCIEWAHKAAKASIYQLVLTERLVSPALARITSQQVWDLYRHLTMAPEQWPHEYRSHAHLAKLVGVKPHKGSTPESGGDE